MATAGCTPAPRMSSGVMSEPPPIPVSPTRMPTPRPKRTTRGSISDVQSALRLGGIRPAALATCSGKRAGGAADRCVAVVVQGVVGQLAFANAPPEVPLRPVEQGIVLPEPPAPVPLHRLGIRAGRRLLAPDAGDPGVGALERALQPGHLGLAAAALGAPRAGRVAHLDRDPEALVEGPPNLERLGEQDARVDRHDAGVGGDADELVDQHRLLLMEGAEHDEAGVVALDRLLEHLGGGHASTSSGVSCSVHHSAGVRLAKARKLSPSSWLVSYRVKMRSNVSFSSQCGTFLTTTSPKRGSGPRRPPMRMSIASTNCPSTFFSTPSIPMSPIWCCAHDDEHPAKCRRKSSPWPLGVTCSSRNFAISAARSFVWTLASPQNSLPVHVWSPRMKSGGSGCRSRASGSASRSATRSLGIQGRSTFCWWVRRTSWRLEYSRDRRAISFSCAARRRPTGTQKPTAL